MQEKKEILQLQKEGLNLTEIGRKLNLSSDTIRRRMIKYGIYKSPKIKHPNLNKTYFEKINTKEKAYWLGFLYADGYVRKNSLSIVLELSYKDKKTIESFCYAIGINKEKITQRVQKNGVVSNLITIDSVEFVSHLIKNGCVNKKSLIIQLPNFNNEEIDLAFFMGYFDGDGSAKSCSLTCGSLKFLRQAKKKYNLKSKINKVKNYYTLNIGAEFKRKLMKNYPNSMERKRFTYRNDKQLKTNDVDYKKGTIKKRKFNISKEELEKLILIDKISYIKIGKIFNVSDNAIKRRAKLLNIKLPIRSKISCHSSMV